jgi:hypothetical protein
LPNRSGMPRDYHYRSRRPEQASLRKRIREIAETWLDTWSRMCPVMRVCRSATAMEVIDALQQARGSMACQ